MTRISCTHSGDRYAIRAEGHATGSQEACSGVSAVTNALMLYAVNAPEHVRAIHAREEGPGAFLLDFEGDEAAGAAWKLTVMGLLSIAKACPEQVAVEGLQ